MPVKTLLVCTCIFLLDSSAAWAQRPPLPEQALPIEHDGFARSFEIARDEVWIADTVERLPQPRPTASAIRDHAMARARALDKPAALVLYEVGVERTDQTRRVLTHEVVVRLAKNADPTVIADDVQASAFVTPEYARGYAVFQAEDALGAAFELAERLRAHPDVLSADPLLARLRFKRYIPNDPLFSDQWHLRNTGQGGGTVGIDIRVTNVWAQGYLGDGLIIGIVDDGVQYTHPDLSPNYEPAYSRNWNGAPGGLYDPAPTTGGSWPDDHGTPCAGLTSARGNNNEGVSGVAPLSQFSGLRLIAGAVGDSEEAESVTYSNQHLYVKSNSWGPSDNGQTMEAPGSLTRAALSNSTVTGRGGLGTIHVWAGGNGLDNNDNANNDGYANSIYTISIAAVGNDGQQAWYSEPGACHIVTGPSSGNGHGIYSTSLMGQGNTGGGDYTSSFGGTSASCPIAAGVVALILEANPNLGWRDVQEILIATARQINPGDSDWTTNAGGFTFNHKFGSGLIDANAAVAAAQSWVNLGPQVIVSSNKTSLGLSIPDNNAAGVSTSFSITNNVRVEQVTITLGISHARRGQLEIFLTSPGGTESRLAEVRSDNNAHPSSWTYMTVQNWGESAQGVWTVRVADRVSSTTGSLNDANLVLFGADDGPPASDEPPVLQPIGNRSTVVDASLAFTVTATDLVDHDVITLTASNLPPWATFPSTSAAGTVQQTFSGTPTATGTWVTTFHASDKDGVDSETITITAHPFIASNFVGVLDESFDTGLPAGWSVTTNGHATAYWRFDNPSNRVNYVGGSDPFAIADSDYAGSVNMDTSLQTPPMNLLTLSEVFVEFRSDFYVYEQATGDVDVSVNGLNGPWINVWRRTADEWGTLEVVDLSAHASGRTNVAVRFRYHNANFDWWWQVDDVKVYGYEVDSDGDGIPDAWELHYFGDLETADAASDFSGNGFLDYHAYLAGTDPTDPVSALRIESKAELTDGTLRIQWQSVADRYYNILRSTNLPAFNAIATGIPATPPLNTYDDESATNNVPYYYRIELDL